MMKSIQQMELNGLARPFLYKRDQLMRFRNHLPCIRDQMMLNRDHFISKMKKPKEVTDVFSNSMYAKFNSPYFLTNYEKKDRLFVYTD